jgi:hypothetical protein
MAEENTTCKVLCHQPNVTGEEAKFINDRIREDYALNWLVDGLPAAEMKVDVRTEDVFFDMGFNLGNNDGQYQNVPVLNNHYDIVLRYDCPLKSLSRWEVSRIPGIIGRHQIPIALSESSCGLQGMPKLLQQSDPVYIDRLLVSVVHRPLKRYAILTTSSPSMKIRPRRFGIHIESLGM